MVCFAQMLLNLNTMLSVPAYSSDHHLAGGIIMIACFGANDVVQGQRHNFRTNIKTACQHRAGT